jgi:predicted TIM-barrel fold metal-dependent hydrolase
MYQYTQLVELFRRHPKTTIIWAHLGLGRVVGPPENMVGLITRILEDPKLKHVHFDISWEELAKYLNSTPETPRRVAHVINQYPERFLFGTDEVASTDASEHYRIVELYGPLWAELTPEASELLRKGNYARLFDGARKKVRAWEKANAANGN